MLDDPDALGGLLGGLDVFGGGRGHVIVAVCVCLWTLFRGSRCGQLFPELVQEQLSCCGS